MQHFDSDYSEEIINRLQNIPPDAVPIWGTMTRDDLVEHFIWVLHHAMGRSTCVPDCSNWFSRSVTQRLVVHEFLHIPRGIQLPSELTSRGITLQESGDLETLHAIIEEYLYCVQADELEPASHPFFGPLDVDGWDRLHVRHFEHHLKQFGV
ncbi:MAG: DUF1569 domain-containing protein [Candidatus Hydrogenedentes bacterium]|nr:DUF1569 domain-containing protein [Candidatus Hydrogenedentota bacterium]